MEGDGTRLLQEKYPLCTEASRALPQGLLCDRHPGVPTGLLPYMRLHGAPVPSAGHWCSVPPVLGAVSLVGMQEGPWGCR